MVDDGLDVAAVDGPAMVQIEVGIEAGLGGQPAQGALHAVDVIQGHGAVQVQVEAAAGLFAQAHP